MDLEPAVAVPLQTPQCKPVGVQVGAADSSRISVETDRASRDADPPPPQPDADLEPGASTLMFALEHVFTTAPVTGGVAIGRS
jgi:hypothetical protein